MNDTSSTIRNEPTFRFVISNDKHITPLSRQGMSLQDIFNDIALMVDDEFCDSFNHMTDDTKTSVYKLFKMPRGYRITLEKVVILIAQIPKG